MKVKVLGSSAPYCKDTRNCSGYLIYGEKNKILLDCGNGVSRNMNFPSDLENLTIIISHLHKDHYADLFAIYYAALVYKAHNSFNGKIDVYIPRVKETDKDYLDYMLIKNLKSEIVNVMDYGLDLNNKLCGEFILQSMFNYHDNMNSYSIKVNGRGTITYSGDMHKSSIDALTEFAYNTGLLIIESSLLEKDKDIPNHLTTKEAGLISLNSKAHKTIITHMFPEIDKNKYLVEVEKICNNVIVANENDIIEV